MKGGQGLAMSEVKKALDVANRQMGDSMGTKYVVDDSLAPAYVHLFKVKTEPEEGRLKESLAKLPGYKSNWKYKEGFGVAFVGTKQPTASEIAKACGLEVVDLILGPSRGGVRYFCPMHPEKTAAAAQTCPVCQMKMMEIAASSLPGTGSGGSIPQVYVCSMDGGMRETPGPCPKCGMDLGKASTPDKSAPERKESPDLKGGKYVCSMDGGQRETPGACPKCGMKLGERDLVAPGGTKAAGKYVCSMDGGTRDTPGKCPKCGMTLTERNYMAPGAKCPASKGRGGS